MRKLSFKEVIALEAVKAKLRKAYEANNQEEQAQIVEDAIDDGFEYEVILSSVSKDERR